MEKKQIRIKLDKFEPRWYQVPLFDAIENKGYKRVLAILPRRAGKDLASWNLIIAQALKRVGVYWYIFPTYAQGKKALFDSIDNDGNLFLDYIPSQLIDTINRQEMKIRLINRSIIQIIGSNNVDALVGSNPRGCVFSEYALTDPNCYKFIRPILSNNDGWCIFVSTPRGRNHLWDLWRIAQNNKYDWFSYKLTVEDTKHIAMENIEKERESGELSEDLIQQEYYCSFSMGVEGAYYTRYLDKMRLNGQIATVPWEPGFPVHTAWDLGMRDKTSIIFFQSIGTTYRVIDCYENSDVGLEHYAKYLDEKPYKYGKHIAPHDIKVRELGTGMSRLEKARHLGIRFRVAPNISVADGIEAVRTTLPKMWIDNKKALSLVKMLESYRKEFDSKKKIYKSHPLHDQYSHMADALRYLCVSLSKIRDGLSAEDIDRNYREAVHGRGSLFPAPLQAPRSR